jgi:hypothetical protein
LQKRILKKENVTDTTKSALLMRCILTSQTVEDWSIVYNYLKAVVLDDTAPKFSNYQATINDEAGRELEEVKTAMYEELKAKGLISRLQNQFALQLLFAAYLMILEEESNTVKADQREISLPDIASLLTELMLTDTEAEELKNIANILLSWKMKN